MSAATAKQLRPVLKVALAEGMGQRGLPPRRKGATDYLGDDTWARPPLQFSWEMEVDSARYGGLRFFGHARIGDPDVDAHLWEFPDAALSPTLLKIRERPNRATDLAFVTGGQLTNPRGSWHEWVVADEARIGPVTEEFFAVVDGPLRAWAAPRRDVQTLLAGLSGSLADDAQHNLSVRSLVLLALDHDDVAQARRLVAGYRPSNTDTPERFAAFEAELAVRYPGYGRIQLSGPRS